MKATASTPTAPARSWGKGPVSVVAIEERGGGGESAHEGVGSESPAPRIAPRDRVLGDHEAGE